MYIKPKLERFGTLRELTMFGASPDCDGGVFGVGSVGSGSTWFCEESARS